MGESCVLVNIILVKYHHRQYDNYTETIYQDLKENSYSLVYLIVHPQSKEICYMLKIILLLFSATILQSLEGM